MIVLDVNVLVSAFREDHVEHSTALPWLERALGGTETIVVPDLVWVGFVRIVTNGRIFTPPSTPARVFEFVNAVRSASGYVAVPGLSDGTDRFERAVTESDASANLIPDAYVAAVAFANAAGVASFDRDFRRFDGLRIIVPSA